MIKKVLINFFRDFLAILGVVWTMTEIFDFFATNISDILRNHYILILILTLVISAIMQIRLIVIRKRIKGSDITIEVKVGNIFNQKGNKVIGVNTNFDTKVDNNFINPDSLHGQFINRYYKNNINKLDSEILTALTGRNIISNQSCNNGKTNRYKIGETIRIQHVDIDFFLLAYSDLSSDWCTTCSYDDIQEAISEFWMFIANSSSNMKDINIPIIGSKFAKLQITRTQIIKDLIRSFIISNKEKKLTSTFRIIVCPKDFKLLFNEWDDIKDFLEYNCSN